LAEAYCGIDFGTSNSSAALSRDGKVEILPLDAENDSPTSLPSLLYITNEGEAIVGRAAANAFIERNVDREIKLEQVDLGISIEGYVASEPDKSESYRPGIINSDVREAVRATAIIESNSPGRLFQSLKTLMRHRSFTGTQVFGENYQIEALVALLLKEIKAGVDKAAGYSVERAVFGRPVRFSELDSENDIAEQRLRTAAGIAGFKDVVFFYEPVGACVEYAMEDTRDQKLMVVDIGGGTCDVCIMHFGSEKGVGERLQNSQVLGVTGVPVAGDMIDREIIQQKLFPLFGSRARYGPAQLPLPQYLFNQILDWQNLYKLNMEETINWLLAAEASSNQPEAIRALRSLIQRNYGYPVAREVEAAKRRLSTDMVTYIEMEKDTFRIHERLERAEFSHIIESQIDSMQKTIIEAEQQAGLKPGEIDQVLTTGGTSLIPAIRQMLEERYTPERLLQRDTFTSVANGLAIVAQYA